MLQRRRAEERGHFDFGWLNTYHSFSFGDYYDPHFMGFRDLRVINEDTVQPGKGFPKHPHHDMEILTYVLEGALEHRDSMGNGSVIQPGEVQRMSAGSGITHSELNASKTEPVHLLQIWILPREKNLQPSYEQKKFEDAEKRHHWRLIASSDGHEGSVSIHQDVRVFAALPAPGTELFYQCKPSRHLWLQVARGELKLNGESLAAGDGLAMSGVPGFSLSAKTEAEVLLFDLS
ncbi:MAG TPA: quercetin 2,3-dioxygenase [Deltaproteobacteria bacterium]|nr:quercetin 2,3-dioxygenase [Deltaproteobacteria bacterium]